MIRNLLCLLFLSHSMSITAKDYVVTDFGAKSDTTVVSTDAVQQCIDRCSADGGGRVVVPVGDYVIGTIILRSNVHLHLELGATLYGSTELRDYRRVKSGLSWNDEGITRPHLLRFIQSRNIVVRDITLKNSGCWMQHYLACDRLRISGIKVLNRNNYNNDALDLDGCHDVIVSDVIADSDDDGITLKSTSPRLCEDVTIQNCIVSSHCNAVKLGTETNGGFRNIAIRGIVVKPSSDQSSRFFGRPIGTSALSLEIVDGGVMENVSVSDLTVTGTESPIFVRLGHRGRGWTFSKSGASAFVSQSVSGGNEGATKSQKPDSVETVGRMRGININNVHVRDAGSYGCSITGLPGHPVEDVHVSNISIHQRGGIKEEQLTAIRQALADEKAAEYPEATMWGPLPAKGFYVRHGRGVKFDRVRTYTEEADARPEFVREDADTYLAD